MSPQPLLMRWINLSMSIFVRQSQGGEVKGLLNFERNERKWGEIRGSEVELKFNST